MPGIPEFIATANNEALDAGSPRFKDITGAEIPTAAPGVLGTAPIEEVEVEEVEEEDPDVHFKRKRQGGSRRKRVVKRPRHHVIEVLPAQNI